MTPQRKLEMLNSSRINFHDSKENDQQLRLEDKSPDDLGQAKSLAQ